MEDNKTALMMCKNCDFESPWNFSLQSHVKRSHQNLKMNMFNCNLAFVQKFLCPDCDYATHMKVQFDNHIRKGHDLDNLKFICEIKPEKWECPNCCLKSFSRFFVRVHNYREHCLKELKVNKENRNLELSCDRRYNLRIRSKTKSGLKPRLKRPILTKLLDCEHCAFKTKHKGSLTRHLAFMHKMSGKIKEFICQQCPFKTKTEQNFKLHILRKHTPDEQIKWFICQQCPFKAKLQTSLKFHMKRKHIPEAQIKWFLCGHCPYKARNKSCMKVHNSRQHASSDEIKWHKCHQCQFITRIEQSLTLHILKKHLL